MGSEMDRFYVNYFFFLKKKYELKTLDVVSGLFRTHFFSCDEQLKK